MNGSARCLKASWYTGNVGRSGCVLCYNRDSREPPSRCKEAQGLMAATRNLPRTLGALRRSPFSEEQQALRTVKDEIRSNLICRLQRREPLFPGIVGYEETVAP